VRVLVLAASRHGATHEIAEAIGAAVSDAGTPVTVARIEDGPGIDAVSAAVVGSAVYMGHWLDVAQRFVEAQGDRWHTIPTWLFSSGPVGSPLKPDDGHAVDVGRLMDLTGAREHRLFAGRLDTGRLGFGERAMMHAVRARAGDYRDWDEIAAWGRAIAAAVRGT